MSWCVLQQRGVPRMQVFLWDRRASNSAFTTLQGPQAGRSGVRGLHVMPDDCAVVAGCESGQVLVWDLRGGHAPVQALGAHGPARHPLLASFHLRGVLARAPSLAAQSASALHSLLVDPGDPRRAAFTLACGWAGAHLPAGCQQGAQMDTGAERELLLPVCGRCGGRCQTGGHACVLPQLGVASNHSTPCMGCCRGCVLLQRWEGCGLAGL